MTVACALSPGGRSGQIRIDLAPGRFYYSCAFLGGISSRARTVWIARMHLRSAAMLAGGLATLVLLALGGIYSAARHVPGFYHDALQADPAARQRQSDELLENAAALASSVGQEGRWHALFTAEQINGWLAVDVAKNFPELVPQGVADP